MIREHSNKQSFLLNSRIDSDKTLNSASNASQISYYIILSIFEMYYFTEAQYYTILRNLVMHQ